MASIADRLINRPIEVVFLIEVQHRYQRQRLFVTIGQKNLAVRDFDKSNENEYSYGTLRYPLNLEYHRRIWSLYIVPYI